MCVVRVCLFCFFSCFALCTLFCFSGFCFFLCFAYALFCFSGFCFLSLSVVYTFALLKKKTMAVNKITRCSRGILICVVFRLLRQRDMTWSISAGSLAHCIL